MSIDEVLLNFSKAKPITSGSLHASVHELAQRAGIETPHIIVTPSKMPNAFMMFYSDGNCKLGLTQGMLDSMGSSTHGKVTPELKAVIGHEFGHVRKGLMPYYVGGYLPMIAMPLASMYVYDQYRNQDAKHQESNLKRFAKDGGVGFLGLIAGGAVARHNAKEVEFYCDRFGAELTTPKAMEQSLRNLTRDGRKAMLEWTAKPENSAKLEEAVFSFKGLYEVLMSYTVMAHPSTGERITRLRELAGTMEGAAAPASRVAGAGVMELGTVLERVLGVAGKIRV